jgi:hypothetical protein
MIDRTGELTVNVDGKSVAALENALVGQEGVIVVGLINARRQLDAMCIFAPGGAEFRITTGTARKCTAPGSRDKRLDRSCG